MKLRHKETGVICSSSRFNTASVDEIIVYYEEGGADSDYIRNYDVWLKSKQIWKNLGQAFKDHDVIMDDLNSCFFEPPTEEDRKRGYTL